MGGNIVDRVAFLYAVLFTAGLNDSVGHGHKGIESRRSGRGEDHRPDQPARIFFESPADGYFEALNRIMERRIDSEKQMLDFGRELARSLQPGAVVALCGGLGAGKTCLTKGLVAGLGSAAAVTSPTFTLVHEYAGGRLEVAHFDFYRVRSAAELVAAGWDDYLDHTDVVIAEWADRFAGLFPPHTSWWQLEHADGGRIVRELNQAPPSPSGDQ